MSSGFPRKGVDVLLVAYGRAFRRADPVSLVIKVFPNPHNAVAKQIAEWQAAHRDPPAITLVDRELDDEEVLDLYRDADAVVLPTRGEGFNLPAAEALAAGLPLIVTGYGGHLDFCDDSVRLIDYSFAPSASHLAESASLWAEPDADDLYHALADAMANDASRGEPASFPTPRLFAERVVAAAVDIMLARPQPRLRVGWVSSWGVRCGIAEYSRHLLEAMLVSDQAPEVTVLCDRRTKPDVPETQGFSVLPCWDLGLVDGPQPLVNAVAKLDPEILVIQHQPGLMAWEALTVSLGSVAVKGRPVVLVLHSTERILDIPTEDRVATIAALRSVARVVVHTVRDVNRLKALNLISNVTMMPQGAIGLDEAKPDIVSADYGTVASHRMLRFLRQRQGYSSAY